MKVNSKNIKKLMSDDKLYIENFELELAKGTKSVKKKHYLKQANLRNEFVESRIKLYKEYKEKIRKEIESRKNIMIPNNVEEQSSKKFNELLEILELIKYENSSSDSKTLLGITKLLCEFDDVTEESIKSINDKIILILDILKQASINISEDDFCYSIYSYNYLTKLVSCINYKNFQDEMKKTFNEIYWECPELIEHLKLNFHYIINNNTKKLDEYFNNCLIEKRKNIDSSDMRTEYNKLNNEYQSLKNCNKYNIFNNFISEKLSINDYSSDSDIYNIYSQFIYNNSYEDLSEKERKDYYKIFIDLGKNIKELKEYYFFEPLIDDLKKIYKNKSNNSKLYEDNIKKIDLLEKERNKMYKNVTKYKKGNIFGKVNQEKVDNEMLLLNQKIKEISSMYSEINKNEIEYFISKNITDSSTLYELLVQASSSFYYLKDMYQKYYVESDEKISLDDFVDKFERFVYGNDNGFIVKTSILTDNISKMILNKYRLFNLKLDDSSFEKDFIVQIEKLITRIINYYYIIESRLTLDDIKFIYKANLIK